jgi:hypothetical protein
MSRRCAELASGPIHRGFFVTVPFLTAWLLWIFWSRIDDVFAPMYQRILGRDLPDSGS